MKTTSLMTKRGKCGPPTVRAEPETTALSVERTFNPMLDEFLVSYSIPPFAEFDRSELHQINPDIDVAETDKEVTVSACLPGLDKKDIAIEVGDGAMTIRGEKNEKCEDKGKDWYSTAESYSAFRRVVPLPPGVNGGKAKAELRKGVLTVALPKVKGGTKGHKLIAVKAA